MYCFNTSIHIYFVSVPHRICIAISLHWKICPINTSLIQLLGGLIFPFKFFSYALTCCLSRYMVPGYFDEGKISIRAASEHHVKIWRHRRTGFPLNQKSMYPYAKQEGRAIRGPILRISQIWSPPLCSYMFPEWSKTWHSKVYVWP